MKKIFSILAAAVIAFSFSSCENGNSVVMNGFKINVDSITSTSAFTHVESSDTATYFSVSLYAAEALKQYSADTLAADGLEEIKMFMDYGFTLEELVDYGVVGLGTAEYSWSELPVNTEIAVVAFQILENESGELSVGKIATLIFRTKPITPKETIALDSLAGTAVLYPEDGSNDFQILVSNSTYEVSITLTEIASAEGSFTEKDFYDDGYYYYNYVEWGSDDNDWTPMATLSIRGSLNANKDKYTFSGSAIGKNEVKYTFDNVTVDYAVYDGTNGAPAKAPARKAAKKINTNKEIKLTFGTIK